MAPAVMMAVHTHSWRARAGFTLVELLVVLAVMGIVSVMALPQLSRSLDRFRVGMAIREIERELQAARVTAVSGNRQIRIMFNCPSAGQFRRVEVLAEPGVPDTRDDQLTRCSTTGFPYPASDRDPLTRPNLDGPLHTLPTGVTTAGIAGIEFSPDGTARSDAYGSPISWAAISQAGVTATVTMGATTRSITINSKGRVYMVKP